MQMMKVSSIDPLVPRTLRLEVLEKLLQLTSRPAVLLLSPQYNIFRVLAMCSTGDVSSSY